MSLHISSFLQIKLRTWDKICKYVYKSATNLFLAQKFPEKAQSIIGNIAAVAVLEEIGCRFTPICILFPS